MSLPILLVEDDPFLSDALKDFFKAEGLELEVASSPTEARRRITGFGERIVVLVDPVAVSLDGGWIRRVAADGHVVVVIAVAIHSPIRHGNSPGPSSGLERRVLSPEALVQMVRELMDPSRVSAFAA